MGEVDGRLGIRGRAVLMLGAVLLVGAAFALCSAATASHSAEYELVESFGPDGTETSSFAGAGTVAFDQQNNLVYVADRTAGKLYKFDAEGNPVDWGGSEAYISGNAIEGLVFEPQGGVRQVAVDSNTHKIYVTSDNSVRAFQEDGEPAEFTSPGGSSSISGFTKVAGVAVDANGFIYASDNTEGLVKIFTPSGEQITQFEVASAANLAVDSNGAVYVNRIFGPGDLGTVLKHVPSEFPVTAVTTYSPASQPVNDGITFGVAVDPATNDVYITQAGAVRKVVVYDENGALITSFAEAGSEGEVQVAEGIAVDGDTTRVYVGNEFVGGLSQAMVFELVVTPPGAPTVEHLAAADVTASTASLHALINPNSLETTYRFEYGLGDCSVSVCTSVPLGGAALAPGHDGIWVSQGIKGLEPSTSYHYQVVAENSLGSGVKKGVFLTQGTNLGFKLADSRAWEMVSPPNKRGALLRGIRNGQIQAAADGNGIAYISGPAIEPDPAGYRVEASSAIARRIGTAWQSEGIATPNTKVVPIVAGQQGEYKLFSPDLSKAILDPRDGTNLSPETSERAPHLRENTKPPVYRPLVTGKAGFANVPPGTVFGGGANSVSAVTIQNATADLSHVVLRSNVALVAGAPDQSLYLWSDGEIEPIAVLPASEGGAIVGAEYSGGGAASMRNAISRDGSRVFWTGVDNHLYMRDMEAEETVQIDVVQAGGSGAGTVKPVFQGASAGGTIVYFSDSQQLTEDASPTGEDLYRCEITEDLSAGCANFANLTSPSSGSGESGEFLGIASALSDDGARIYFVARGGLEADPNPFGHVPVPEEPNMFLWEEGEGLRFIATLAEEDRPNWGLPGTVLPPGLASSLSTASSSDGRYFAFMSERQVTDPDDPGILNVDVDSGEAVQQVFRYDAIAGQLDCVSCAPTGAAPRGTLIDENPLVDPRQQWRGRHAAAILPQAVTINEGGPNLTIYHPRAVLDNGRVFFNAIDSLVPADSNANWDVYQYEDLGVGDCAAASGNAGVARLAGGCVSLMSSGTGETEMGFLDASISGDDVFFLTPARLNATDFDGELDIYDARVGGTPATLPPVTDDCVGEACRPVPPVPPGLGPSSSVFDGPGNVKPARKCPKGKRKVKRSGKQRCVPRKAKKHRKRSGERKGAGR